MLAALLVWWLAPESVFTGLDAHAERFGALTAPVVAAVLTVSLLGQVGKTILTRRGEPLAVAAAGLVRYLVTVCVGVAVVGLGLGFADAATAHFLGTAMPGFVDRLTEVLQLPRLGVGAQILVGLTVLVLGAVQWLLMFFRQAGIFVLIAVLPIAASGALTGYTRRWLPTVVAWLAALICYKPFAGLIYAIGMTLMSSPAPAGEGAPPWAPVLVGIVVLALAVIALPALMKFFSFTGAAVSGGGATGGVLVGAATGAISLAGGARSGQRMELTGPDSGALPAPTGSTPGNGRTGSGSSGGGAGADAGSAAHGGQPDTPTTQTGPAPAPEPGPAAAGGGTDAQMGASGAGAGATGGVTVVAAAAQAAARAVTDQMTTPPAPEHTTATTATGGPGGADSGRAGPSGASATPPGADGTSHGAGGSSG